MIGYQATLLKAVIIVVIAVCSAFFAACDICNSSVAVSERDVVQFILANYTKQVRPRRNSSLPVEVTLSFRISAVHDLIERENTLVLDGYLYTEWHNEYLVWNCSFPYSCLQQLVLPQNLTWLPDIALVNTPSSMYSLKTAPGFTVWLESDGLAIHAPGGEIISQCEVDVTYFPFDKQICSVNFESWNYDITMQTFKLSPDYPFVIIDSSWTENGQWLIEANYSRLSTVSYFDPNDYSHIEFILVLRRKSLFYYVNVIVPSLIISVVELATFVLPIDEVIKIHISFTCLLAYSVFQEMVISDLPRSGDAVPLLSLYIDLQMAYIGIIALLGEAVVFVIIRKATRKKPPSQFVVAAFQLVGRILSVESVLASKEILDEHKSQDSNQALLHIIATMKTIFYRDQPKNNSISNAEKGLAVTHPSSTESIYSRWIFIAEVVERINMLVYIAAITVTPFVMFYIAPKEDKTKLK